MRNIEKKLLQGLKRQNKLFANVPGDKGKNMFAEKSGRSSQEYSSVIRKLIKQKISSRCLFL